MAEVADSGLEPRIAIQLHARVDIPHRGSARSPGIRRGTFTSQPPGRLITTCR
jgi:hypothetical protein